MTTGDSPPVRVGNEERRAAMAALDEHLAQGRLDPQEYGERSAVAANAVFAADLHALFRDLPAPHPALPGLEVAVPPADPEPPDRTSHSSTRWLLPAAVSVAVLLFVLTRQWWWFMLIPAAAMYAGRRG